MGSHMRGGTIEMGTHSISGLEATLEFTSASVASSKHVSRTTSGVTAILMLTSY